MVWQVLVIFLGANRFMMWHRPGELQPLSAGKEAKVQQARALHDAKKLGRPFSQFQTALEVRLPTMLAATPRHTCGHAAIPVATLTHLLQPIQVTPVHGEAGPASCLRHCFKNRAGRSCKCVCRRRKGWPS